MMKPVIFCLIILVGILQASPSFKYGPFNMLLNAFDVCVGPKSKDCTILKGEIIGKNIIFMTFKALTNCSPTKGKIIVSSNGKELTRLQMNKPCEHIFLRPLLTTLFNATKNCEILKGDYSKKLDLGQIFDNYFGGNFFYGNISFRSHLYSNDCNFSCSILHVTMSPK